MKKILFFIIMIISVTASAQSKNSPQIKFESESYDFGRIKEESGIVTTIFKFKNISEKPYIIKYTSVSCGCTTPSYDKKPVMPGKEAEIKVAYNPEGRPGKFSKSIYVVDGSGDYINELVIKGDVEARPRTIEDDFPVVYPDGLRASSTSIQYRNIPVGYRHSLIIELYNGGTNAISLDAKLKGDNKRISVTVPKSLAPKAKGQLIVTYDLKTAPEFYGILSEQIDLSVNGTNISKPITVKGNSTPDFTVYTPDMFKNAPVGELDGQFYHFGTASYGRKLTRDFKLTNTGINDLEIVGVIPSSENLKYTLPKKVIKNGESIDITMEIILQKGGSGRKSESLILITNDPTEPVKEIRLAATQDK